MAALQRFSIHNGNNVYPVDFMRVVMQDHVRDNAIQVNLSQHFDLHAVLVAHLPPFAYTSTACYVVCRKEFIKHAIFKSTHQLARALNPPIPAGTLPTTGIRIANELRTIFHQFVHYIRFLEMEREDAWVSVENGGESGISVVHSACSNYSHPLALWVSQRSSKCHRLLCHTSSTATAPRGLHHHRQTPPQRPLPRGCPCPIRPGSASHHCSLPNAI
ncbi:hypothetical protein CB0940_04796 [Cercospora beticola]|uniref:Uncharacterized protein n=1 Tax=Cercospora beticola TaxID=122368 RepID=A0A2G5HKP0_CERBT|nr:hypothetical protein CB0940_04796 [Cercospora beticola]PIA93124.1 hypothetical protein CB0940_04796 [Cercospora beticola]